MVAKKKMTSFNTPFYVRSKLAWRQLDEAERVAFEIEAEKVKLGNTDVQRFRGSPRP